MGNFVGSCNCACNPVTGGCTLPFLDTFETEHGGVPIGAWGGWINWDVYAFGFPPFLAPVFAPDLYNAAAFQPGELQFPINNPGLFVDLVGSHTRYDGGLQSKCVWMLEPGIYELSLRLCGSKRNGSITNTTIVCGDFVNDIVTLQPGDDWRTLTYQFAVIDIPQPAFIRITCHIVNQTTFPPTIDRGSFLDDVSLVKL